MGHRAETGRKEECFSSAFPKLREPLFGHNEALIRPKGLVSLNFEVEYAVVIGQTERNVSVSKTMDCVDGYTILNDGTIHEF